MHLCIMVASFRMWSASSGTLLVLKLLEALFTKGRSAALDAEEDYEEVNRPLFHRLD